MCFLVARVLGKIFTQKVDRDLSSILRLPPLRSEWLPVSVSCEFAGRSLGTSNSFSPRRVEFLRLP